MSSSDLYQGVAIPDDLAANPPLTPVLERLTDRRRAILARLLDDDAVRVPTLAERLAAADADAPTPDPDAVDRVAADLYHVHVPVLESVGLLERDRAAGTVATSDHPLYDDPDFRRFLESDAELEDLVDCLANECRRAVLEVLDDRAEPISRDDLARAAAPPLSTRAEELRVDLHHVHLPKLDAMGLLEYDAATAVVEPAPAGSTVEVIKQLTGR